MKSIVQNLCLSAWVCLLIALCVVCSSVLTGRNIGGVMSADPSPVVFSLFTLPVLGWSPWAIQMPWGKKFSTYAGWAIGLTVLWWVFWLPASLQGMAPSERYGADQLGIPIPAQAIIQMAVVGIAVWLLSISSRFQGWYGLSHWAVYSGLTGLSLAIAEPAVQCAMTQPAFTAIGLLAPAAMYAQRSLVRPGQSEAQLGLRWVAAQSLLMSLWTCMYHWGNHLPAGVNNWGASWL
jgi:hypothetical protein